MYIISSIAGNFQRWLLPADLLVHLLTAAHPNAKSLNYSGIVEEDGIPAKRRWTVSWTEKYGPPAPSTIRTFVALYQIWKDAHFESRKIDFDVRDLVKRSAGAGNPREPVEVDLYILYNTSIRHKDGGFGLFESVAIGQTGGYMVASPALHYTVLNTPQLLDKFGDYSEIRDLVSCRAVEAEASPKLF